MALPYQWQMRVERLKRMFGGMFGGDNGERRPAFVPHAERWSALMLQNAMNAERICALDWPPGVKA